MPMNIEEIMDMIKKGYDKNHILKFIDEDLYELAYSRILAKQKLSFSEQVYSDIVGIQTATPELIAEYKAKRLKTDIIADLSCGIGIQSLFFSKYSNFVYAVDVNEKRLDFAKKNTMLFNRKNIEFINNSAEDPYTITHVKDSTLIFSDPARAKNQNIQLLENLSPSPLRIIDLYKDHKDIAFDIPAQITEDRLNFDCEKEFISIGGEIIRQSLYLGSLKKCEKSALILPGEHRLCFNHNIDRNFEIVDHLENYIYELDPAITYASLIPEITREHRIKIFESSKKRTLATSDSLSSSPFFKNIFVVKEIIPFETNAIKDALIKNSAKSVILKFKISDSEYWPFRNTLEKNLSGSKTLYIFKISGRAVIAELKF
ncbi:MAG: class I SAM-dependent methyltransferase [Thermoplasmata archaeon]